MSDAIRAFYAVPISQACQNDVGNIQQQLKKQYPKNPLGWSKLENLHVTLYFFKNLPVNMIDELHDKVTQNINILPEFSLNFDHVAPFPKQGKPCAITFYMHPLEPILQLGLIMRQVIDDCGLGVDRRAFSPHMTIAKIKKISPIVWKPMQIQQHSSMLVDHITLMQSELTPEGPIYTPIRRTDLKRKNA